MNLEEILDSESDDELSAYARTAKIDFGSVASLNKAAALFIRSDLFQEARGYLEKSFAIDPHNLDVMYLCKLLKLQNADGPHARLAVIRDATVSALETASVVCKGDLLQWRMLEHVLWVGLRSCLCVGPDEMSLQLGSQIVRLFPDREIYRRRYSQALANTGDFLGAIKQLLSAHKLAPSNESAAELEDLRKLLGQGQQRHGIQKGRYPSTEEMKMDLKRAIKAYVINEIDLKAFSFELSSQITIFTMGSCFAREVSGRLCERGYKSHHIEVGEYINSTYANLEMMRWTERRCSDEANEKRLNDLLLQHHTPETILERIRTTDLFIYTLGVAPCFFDKKSGAFVMPRASAINNHALAEVFDFRTTTVRENVENLQKIFDFILKHNPAAKFVVTLSPVPLKVTFERKSAVLADCLSKSTLRLAAEEIVASNPSYITYWPSFEIVKWLGGHVGPFYGVDDGAAWHVSASVIRLITDLFIETFSGD